jgi:hypothetical protein
MRQGWGGNIFSLKPNLEHFKPLTDNTGMNAISMTQYSMKHGLIKFGQKGVDSLITKVRQLDTRKILDPVHESLLSKDDRRKVKLQQMRCT